MKISKRDENGVSPIIGEMLMLSLVLILAALFAVSASQYIPEDREPSLNVMMEDYSPNVTISDYNFTLWHKGGDTLSNQSIKIILSNKSRTIPLYAENISINNTKEANFMPGDWMEIDTGGVNVSGYNVQMVVSKSVVFFGRVQG
ncbi:type IV pilin N-terminal domain-containing protein [Methanolacinia paynteri]|uniref:type IV pilin N-terminal domain-containing protein n=1 Tax=Methanolacinia paynteri TaxID=230356 RepID=UPI00064E2154|nr:type IV pilin N-terminal domain-containing protein [Methanolacinia paynteri]